MVRVGLCNLYVHVCIFVQFVGILPFVCVMVKIGALFGEPSQRRKTPRQRPGQYSVDFIYVFHLATKQRRRQINIRACEKNPVTFHVNE